jgi:hypothetical protein
MVRSASAIVVALLIPSFLAAQERQGTHTVVRGDTLWDLAQRYYSNPFQWRVIWDANRDVVEDPNWIYPAEVIVIPGLPADDTPVAEPEPEPEPEAEVEPEPEPEPEPEVAEVPQDLAPYGMRQARPQDESRTVFWTEQDTNREDRDAALAASYIPVSADLAYSVPWLIGLEGDPDNTGMIAGFADRGARASSIRSFDQIRITMPSPGRIGARVQLFRVSRSIESVGQVVEPTGVATIRAIGDGEVVAIVTKEYGRIQPGDFVRPLPAHDPTAGAVAEEVSGGSEAMVMGFAGNQELADIGHVVFLDLGSNNGISIGDEFVLFGDAIQSMRDGSLQVIGVSENTSAARVMSMADNVFVQGVVVRLVKKMR